MVAPGAGGAGFVSMNHSVDVAARCLRRTTPSELAQYDFPAGSMGPKVAAACEFVASSGHPAAIGSLADIEEIVAGNAGTLIEPDVH